MVALYTCGCLHAVSHRCRYFDGVPTMMTKMRCKESGEILEFDVDIKTDQHYVLASAKDNKTMQTECLSMEKWEVAIDEEQLTAR